MGDKLKGYWTKISEKVKPVAKKVPKKLLIILAVVLIVVAAVIAIVLNNRPYSVLFTELNSDEASTIMSYLEDAGVTDYRLQNGDTIVVPTSQVDTLKAKLLMEGYPKSGFAYTYTEGLSALSTESERNQAILQDLQERMSATIRCMDGVKDAVVTLTQGEDHSYVLDSGNVVNASASVLVTMRNDESLSSQMAEAIRTLVSHGVQGLEIDNVSIIDSLGNTYDTESSGSADSDASSLKLQLEEKYNNKIRTEVLQALIPFFGEDNVKVGVNCTVDVSYSEQNSTDVYLPEWAQDGSTNGAGIIGSRVYEYTFDDAEDTVAEGVVGTETNSDLSTYVEQEPSTESNPSRVSGSGQIDYNNSQDQTYTVRTAGYITDCTISVSINATTAGTINTESIREHVARAAGISAVDTDEMTAQEYLASKISVLSMSFYEPPMEPVEVPVGFLESVLPDWLPWWAVYAAAGGLLLFVIILVVILILTGKRRKRKKKEALAEDPTLEALLESVIAPTEPQGADVMELQSERSLELRKAIRRFVDENPELAAQLIKTWLRGGEDNG
jgi:flagellar M-ring protein FliF